MCIRDRHQSACGCPSCAPQVRQAQPYAGLILAGVIRHVIRHLDLAADDVGLGSVHLLLHLRRYQLGVVPVSYTHLDVYKRQIVKITLSPSSWRSTTSHRSLFVVVKNNAQLTIIRERQKISQDKIILFLISILKNSKMKYNNNDKVRQIIIFFIPLVFRRKLYFVVFIFSN